MRAVHHLDVWVTDPATALGEWGWLLAAWGWEVDLPDTSWVHDDGTYLFLQGLPAPAPAHDRMAAGYNHLALTVPDRETLDRIRAESHAHGWRELFADRYPHAGGEEHTALYVENSEGFEVEIVVEP